MCVCVCDQDLQLALEKARSVLQEREEQLREGEQERQQQEEEREATIRELRTSLLTKEQLIEVRDTPTNCNTAVMTEASHSAHVTGTQILHTAESNKMKFLCRPPGAP